MSNISIDKLQLEVEGSADKAEKSLDKLISKLDKLTSTINKCTGMTRIANQIDKITTAINNASGIEKVERLCASLEKFQNIKAPNVTKAVNAINKLTTASNAIGSLSNLEQLKSNISAITDACKPMENMGKNTLTPFLNSLKKIPEITNSLDTKTLDAFAERIKRITSSITPLTNAVAKSQAGLVSLNNIIRSTTASNGNLAASNATAVRSFTSLGGIISSVKLKLAAVYLIARKVGSVLSDCLDSSNAYVENLNLFSVSMGDAAQSALEYAQKVNQLLGIDVSDWIRNQGVFKQIASGFGVITEKANLMSQNLTQIGYDISSFFNISVEDAMQKVQSGISGELEPLRRLGYALDAATLQQIAYNNGITQNINTMTQAQKSQLRYIAILQQSTNVMGDMARTIVTPANSMRILSQQIEQMKRALGNVVSVIAMKVIPYVQVAVRLLTDLGNWLAKKMGFELPKVDYSGVSNGISSIADNAEEATEAVKETEKQLNWLAGFDEITKVPSQNDNNDNGSDTMGNNFDLGVDLPEYDFLKDLNNQTDKLYKRIKGQLKDLYKWWQKHKDIIKVIAGLLAGIWALTKIKKFIDKVKALKAGFDNLSVIKTAKGWLKSFTDGFKNSEATGFFGKINDGVKNFRNNLSPAAKILGTIVGSVSAGIGSYNLFKNLAADTLTWKSALGDAALIVGGLGVSWLFGGVKGLALGAIVSAFAALAGAAKGAKEECDKALDRLIDAEWNTAGKNITDVADSIDQYYSKLTESDQTYLDSMSDLEQLSSDAETTAKKIDLLIDTLNSDDFNPENITKIRDEFKNLADTTRDYIQQSNDNFELFILANSDMLESQGYSVTEMTRIVNGGTDNSMNKIDELLKKVDDLTSKSSLSDDDLASLKEYENQLQSMAGIDVDETTTSIKAFKDEVDNLASQEINLENFKTAQSTFEKMGEKYADTLNLLKDSKKTLQLI